MNFTDNQEEVEPVDYTETNPVIIDLYEQIIANIKESIIEKNKLKQLKPEDGKYLRISTLTAGCLRKDFYHRTDNIESELSESDFTSMVKMDMGTENHETIQNYMVKMLHGVEERYYDDELMLTGGNDGVFTVNNAMFELKTIGFTSFHYYSKLGKPNPKHVKQVTAYIYERNRKYANTEGYVPLNKAYLLYWNRNLEPSFGSPTEQINWQRVFAQQKQWEEMGLNNLLKIFEVEYSEELIEEIKQDVRKFFKKVEDLKVPAKTVDLYLCKECRFKERCGR